MRHRFLDYTGDFVIHCHILGHEDRGMMQRIGVRETPEARAADLEAETPSCAGPSDCCLACLTPEFGPDLPGMCKAEEEPTGMGMGPPGPVRFIRSCTDE